MLTEGHASEYHFICWEKINSCELLLNKIKLKLIKVISSKMKVKWKIFKIILHFLCLILFLVLFLLVDVLLASCLPTVVLGTWCPGWVGLSGSP